MLTARWNPLRRHAEQHRLINSAARFRIAAAGRRSGKTERAKRYAIQRGLTESLKREFDVYRYFLAAPTRDQAKAIYWHDLKAMIPPAIRLGAARETELTIATVTGAEFCVVGLDKPQRIEGRAWNGGILDEYANMKPEAWPENIRPALSDRLGWCWMIGVPEGRNHYYDLYREAANRPDWDTFSWISADILPPEEIASARQDLDELTFQQEYEASFVNFQGRAYYNFTDDNIRPSAYIPADPLIFCFDFNVAPGVAAIAQERNGMTQFINEMWIRRGSNTERISKMLLEEYAQHQGPIFCYGDASGGASGSAKLAGSDWDIIRRMLTPIFGNRLTFNIPRKNPDERQRINAVNTRMKSTDGTIRCVIDPKCTHLIKDFEGVSAAEDGSIQKKAGDILTHISDGAGYYIAKEFPVVTKKAGMAAVVGL